MIYMPYSSILEALHLFLSRLNLGFAESLFMHQWKTVESFPYNDTKEILKNDTGQLSLVSLVLNDNQRVN